MITNLLLDLVKILCDWLVSILPPFSFHIPPAVKDMCGWLLGFDAFLPVHECLLIISTVGTIFAVLTLVKWSIKVIDWIMDVIP